MTITPEQIAELRTLMAKATPGPHFWNLSDPIQAEQCRQHELRESELYGAMYKALPGLLEAADKALAATACDTKAIAANETALGEAQQKENGDLRAQREAVTAVTE